MRVGERERKKIEFERERERERERKEMREREHVTCRETARCSFLQDKLPIFYLASSEVIQIYL